jgi:peptidoglycan/LPS O-acetylase OafA/YrhL
MLSPTSGNVCRERVPRAEPQQGGASPLTGRAAASDTEPPISSTDHVPADHAGHYVKPEFRRVPLRESNNFDVIRLFAAVSVMVVHVSHHLHCDLGALGTLLTPFPGVPIFYVVSGFLISRSWQRRPDWKQYARNRLLRIFPALYVCFAISLLTIWVAGYSIVASRHTVSAWVIAQLTIGQEVTPSFMNGYGVGALNGSLWTIPIELEFYLVLPLLVRWRPLVWVCGVASVVILKVAGDAPLPGGFSLLETLVPNFYMFALGMLAARYFDQVVPYVAGRAHWWLAAYLAVVGVDHLLGIQVGTNQPDFFSMWLLAGLVISAAHSAPHISDKLLRGNDLSYGIYIYHMVVVNFLVQTRHPNFAVAVIVSLLLAIASWLLVERPALARKQTSTSTLAAG